MNSANASHDRPLIGLITNPHSRRNRSGLAAVERLLAERRGIHHCITRSAQDIPAALRTLAGQGVEVIAINGGDGTTAQVFGALLDATSPFKSLPDIVLLPGGTTNMNAADVGLRGSLKHSVETLCRWSGGENLSVQRLSRPVLKIDGAVEQDALFGMFFGAGSIIIGGIEHCTRHVHRVGLTDEIGPGVTLLRAAWGILRGDPQFAAPINVRLRVDEQEARQEQLAILLVTSLERLFLGMHPWWGREQQPLHGTWIEKSAPGLLRKLLSLLRGKPGAGATPENGYFSHNARQLELDMDATFTVDGELYRASREHGPLRISQGGELVFLKIRA